jgi:signal transduction histidine kinase
MPQITPFTGVIVYDSNGIIEYPPIDTNGNIEYDLPDIFAQAWAFEFQKQQYREAAEIYDQISESESNDYIKRLSIIGHARCLQKQGKLYEAYKLCARAYRYVSSREKNAELFEPVEQTKAASIPLIVQAKILHISILRQMYETKEPLPLNIDYHWYGDMVGGLWILAHYDYSPVTRAMDAETRIYLLHKFIELADDDFLRNIMKEYSDLPIDQNRIEKMRDYILEARNRLIAEELALDVAKRYPTSKFLENWQPDSLHKLDVAPDTYGLAHKYLGKSYLALVRPETIQVDIDVLDDVFRESLFDYEIIDSKYNHIAGITNQSNEMVLETGLGGYFSDWKIRLYYKDDVVFENAAKRTKFVYGWTAALVIGLMTLTCGYAIKAILRQAAVNRLKNDFVATVTHELKTPLASMRVLVDTLLEGRYNDQQQATEYLQLIAKENRRLTGLIDNFLSFSRMERNKQAFDLDPASPADIATCASDAVRTKFNDKNCKFTVNIEDNLPPVMADKDAMVTVLVNLLDNAYKYSHENKQIELNVFAAETGVCFSVKDSGIGMTPRQTKKIFNRFYQADSSLSRKTEGTGLGLSIVKFILDAHKASITVESQPGEGSVFTIKLGIVDDTGYDERH